MTKYLLAIDNITWKTIHRFLVDNQDSNPPMAKKRLTEIAFNKEECRKIYSLPLFCSHKRNKTFIVSVLNYSQHTLHNAVLYKMKRLRIHSVLITQMWGIQSSIYLYPVLLQFPSGPTSPVSTSVFQRKL